MTLNAGQDNKSEASDAALRIQVYKDNSSDTFVDIPFNESKPLEIDVTNVNSLKIELSMRSTNGEPYPGPDCITGVLFDMKLD